MAQQSLATYYRSGGFRKVYPCRPGEQPGTVDLLGEDGAAIVTGCPVVEYPETYEGRLPDGYAVVDREAAAPKKKRAGYAAKAVNGEPSTVNGAEAETGGDSGAAAEEGAEQI